MILWHFQVASFPVSEIKLHTATKLSHPWCCCLRNHAIYKKPSRVSPPISTFTFLHPIPMVRDTFHFPANSSNGKGHYHLFIVENYCPNQMFYLHIGRILWSGLGSWMGYLYGRPSQCGSVWWRWFCSWRDIVQMAPTYWVKVSTIQYNHMVQHFNV